VVRDLRPTLSAARQLSPDLRTLFTRLGVGPSFADRRLEGRLPCVQQTLRAAKPLLNELWPFLQQLNPSLAYVGLYSQTTADFIGFGAGGLAATIPSPSGGVATTCASSARTDRRRSRLLQREANNRGNAYLGPTALAART